MLLRQTLVPLAAVLLLRLMQCTLSNKTPAAYFALLYKELPVAFLLLAFFALLDAAAHYLRRMALAINTAMNMSGGMAAAAAAGSGPPPPYGQQAAAAGAGPYDRQQQQQRGNKQHVADLLLVKARPVYGYYAEESLFVKVVL
jgi:hypothetical protein